MITISNNLKIILVIILFSAIFLVIYLISNSKSPTPTMNVVPDAPVLVSFTDPGPLDSPWHFQTAYAIAYYYQGFEKETHGKLSKPLLLPSSLKTNPTIKFTAVSNYSTVIFRTSATAFNLPPPLDFGPASIIATVGANKNTYTDVKNPYSKPYPSPKFYSASEDSTDLKKLPFRIPTFYAAQYVDVSDPSNPIPGPLGNAGWFHSLTANNPKITFVISPELPYKISLFVSGDQGNNKKWTPIDLQPTISNLYAVFIDSINSLYSGPPPITGTNVTWVSIFPPLPPPTFPWYSKTSYGFALVDPGFDPEMCSSAVLGITSITSNLTNIDLKVPQITFPKYDTTYNLIAFRTDNTLDFTKNPVPPTKKDLLLLPQPTDQALFAFTDIQNPYIKFTFSVTSTFNTNLTHQPLLKNDYQLNFLTPPGVSIGFSVKSNVDNDPTVTITVPSYDFESFIPVINSFTRTRSNSTALAQSLITYQKNQIIFSDIVSDSEYRSTLYYKVPINTPSNNTLSLQSWSNGSNSMLCDKSGETCFDPALGYCVEKCTNNRNCLQSTDLENKIGNNVCDAKAQPSNSNVITDWGLILDNVTDASQCNDVTFFMQPNFCTGPNFDSLDGYKNGNSECVNSPPNTKCHKLPGKDITYDSLPCPVWQTPIPLNENAQTMCTSFLAKSPTSYCRDAYYDPNVNGGTCVAECSQGTKPSSDPLGKNICVK